MSNTVPNERHVTVRIEGMHCGSCEILLERKLRAVQGVKRVSIHHKTGIAKIVADADCPPSPEDIRSTIENAGYRLRLLSEPPSDTEQPHRKWVEIGAAFLIIVALYKVLQAFDLVSLAPSVAGVSTIGGIFIIGLVAGTSSCLAVTGGLLLSVAAKYNEAHRSQTRWERFEPLLHFNIGRLVSYFFFGGLVGFLGQSITLTTRLTGYMSIIVALIMLSLALSILKIIPKGSFGIRPPRRLSRWIAGLAESKHPLAPFSLGALTFFLPCGFTQSLQLIALASGSFLAGATAMFVFALGTLPALLGISAISSTAKGTFSRIFLRFSGVLVFILALWNLNSGLLLTGVDAASFLPGIGSSTVAYAGNDPAVTESQDGTQYINMRVRNGYQPNSFTVKADKPTVLRATADPGNGGCTSILTVPVFGLTKFLRPGENELGPFTPTQDFLITCGMGMVRANVRVVGEGAAVAVPAAAAEAAADSGQIPANAQVRDLTLTRNGYAPNVLEVEHGRPTVVRVSSEVPAGGCMGVIAFPNFDQSAFVPAPGSPPASVLLATDRAEPGDYPITCSMGSRMAVIRVRLRSAVYNHILSAGLHPPSYGDT